MESCMSGDHDEEMEDCMSSDHDDENHIEDDWYGFCDAFIDESALFKASGPSIQVIRKECLHAAQMEDLRRVMDLLLLKEQHARTLLIHNRWNVDKVLDVLIEKGKDRLYTEAGVTMVEDADALLSRLSSTVTCEICTEDVSANVITAMDCGHYFCNTCWTQHFIVKINEGQSRRIRCMEYKCNAVSDEVKVRYLLNAREPDMAEKFDQFLLESYIEDNRSVKWCPSVPHCGNAIRVEDGDLCEVECPCGQQFCFGCLSEPHSPCSCLMWEQWRMKNHKELESVNWITFFTKPCPRCGKTIEKNGGCDVMTCICGQHFLWTSGFLAGYEDYPGMINHRFNRYKKEQEEQAKKSGANYHDSYMAHTQNFKLESELKKFIEEKVSYLERKSTYSDLSWVTNGLYKLLRSRRVLSYSYPFAFFMFGDDLFTDEMTKGSRVIKQNLFEDLQQQFEANVKELSFLLKRRFEYYPEEYMMKFRTEFINHSSITDILCKKFYELIENYQLDSLPSHRLAPYNPNGVDKASELPDYSDINA